jgi:hypothetical protein
MSRRRNDLDQALSMAMCPIRTTAHQAGCLTPSNADCFVELLRGVGCSDVLMNLCEEVIVVARLPKFVPNYAWRPKQSKMFVLDSCFVEMFLQCRLCKALFATDG